MTKNIWEQEIMPSEWSLGILCPIHKNEDQLWCENYSRVTLLNTAHKTFSNVMYARVLP
jgi:hypothetical protein